MPQQSQWEGQSIRSHWYRELEQTRHPLASHLSDGNMRAPPVVGSESASVDPVGRGIVLSYSPSVRLRQVINQDRDHTSLTN
jgi:hypothetical protein